MRYYKDKDNGVFAYDDEQLAQVTRLSDVELLLSEKEPVFTAANNHLQQATLELNEANELLNITVANSVSDDEETAIENDEEIQRVKLIVEDKTSQLDDAKVAFNQIEAEYQPLKDEFDAILPVFFDIREHLTVLKKMSPKEVDAYLNPPVSKEQLIVEAEKQKQSCADDAEKNITILERKVRLNMATEDDKNSLTAWEIYSIKISDIDTATAPEIDWPAKPE